MEQGAESAEDIAAGDSGLDGIDRLVVDTQIAEGLRRGAAAGPGEPAKGEYVEGAV